MHSSGYLPSLLPPPKRALKQKVPIKLYEKISIEKIVDPQDTYEEDDRRSDSDSEELFTFQPMASPISNYSKPHKLDIETIKVKIDEVTREELATTSDHVPVAKKSRQEFPYTSTATIKEIRQVDQLNLDEAALMNRLVAEETAVSLMQASTVPTQNHIGGVSPVVKKPTGLAKAKNHVSSLAFQVVQKEKQLNEYHSSAKAAQLETKSRYGF